MRHNQSVSEEENRQEYKEPQDHEGEVDEMGQTRCAESQILTKKGKEYLYNVVMRRKPTTIHDELMSGENQQKKKQPRRMENQTQIEAHVFAGPP